MISVAENKYGKSRVRLVQVKRKAGWHDLREWTVEVLLQGDFDSCFVEGDNSRILPTDTMKNTIYSLARNSAATCMEDFAKELIDFLLHRNPQVSAAEVSISEKVWNHLESDGKPHPTTFVQSSGETQTTKVTRNRASEFSISAGFEAPQESGGNSIFMDLYASLAKAHMRDHGTTQRQLAMVSAKNHTHSSMNPLSQYRTAMSVEEVLGARVIAWPLTLPMCAPISAT